MSGRYYRGDSQWVSNAYDALTFANVLDAEEFCRVHRLHGLQMIQQSGYFYRAPQYRGRVTNVVAAAIAMAKPVAS